MARLIDTINRKLSMATAEVSELTEESRRMEEALAMLKYRLAKAETAREMALADLAEYEKTGRVA